MTTDPENPRIVNVSQDDILWSDGRRTRIDKVGVSLNPPARVSVDLESLGPVGANHVLVVRGLDVDAVADLASVVLSRFGRDAPVIVNLNGDETIELLNEDDMRRCGWVRA